MRTALIAAIAMMVFAVNAHAATLGTAASDLAGVDTGRGFEVTEIASTSRYKKRRVVKPNIVKRRTFNPPASFKGTDVQSEYNCGLAGCTCWGYADCTNMAVKEHCTVKVVPCAGCPVIVGTCTPGQ